MNHIDRIWCACLMGIMLLNVMPVNAEIELTAGDPAPGFVLADQQGLVHTLEDYAGSWLVLYFYPRDDTPGCTIEACNFREYIYLIRDLGAEVVGISIDSIESHSMFAQTHRLPFTLLADTNGEVAASYGSLMDNGPVSFARRHTFIIDDRGKIARIYRRVDPRKHSKQVVGDLEELLSR